MHLFELLDTTARRFPDHGAVFSGTAQRSTYRQLRQRALEVAAGLRARWSSGTRCAIVSENRPEYLEVLFGVWAADMVTVPINAKLHPNEIATILRDAGASVVFASPSVALANGHFQNVTDNGPALLEFGAQGFVELGYRAAYVRPSVSPDSLAWLFYTSGTTGRAKGAMLSHRNLLAMTIAHLADIEVIDEQSSLLHAAPLSHGSGLYVLPYVARGARQVIPSSCSFESGEVLDLCDVHPSCSLFLAPTMVQRLRLEATRRGHLPKHLRTIIYGGGPMYLAEMRKSLATLGEVFVQIYGQGESPMTITALRRQDHITVDDAVLSSVGWARSGVEVAVVTPSGEPVALDQTGEIVVRGDTVMAGYWNNPDATAETLRDGWLFTGDLGSMDARGYLTLRDRSKDLIISGGSNIYPREVEEVLLDHASVAQACVVGQPDAEWGESVVAFIVRAVGTEVTRDELDRHCLARIARFKRPKRYVFVDTMPTNSIGKISKRDLRERLATT